MRVRKREISFILGVEIEDGGDLVQNSVVLIN